MKDDKETEKGTNCSEKFEIELERTLEGSFARKSVAIVPPVLVQHPTCDRRMTPHSHAHVPDPAPNWVVLHADRELVSPFRTTLR